MGAAHFGTLQVLKSHEFEEKQRGTTLIVKEPIGVCGFITPWNWPLNQIACKGGARARRRLHDGAQAVGNRALQRADLRGSAQAAGVPAGVFNMVNGDGPGVGAAISSHPGVDMVSFTGSTRAGIEVAKNAAPTIKRVHQELGGKSPNIILEDADLKTAVTGGVRARHEQFRPVLQRADAHAGAEGQDGRCRGYREGGSRGDDGGRPLRQFPRWGLSSPKCSGTRSRA